MTTIHKSAAVGKSEAAITIGKSEAAIAIDFETYPDGELLTVAGWAKRLGKAMVMATLREALRADYHPLARLFLMLADEGLIPPIPHREPGIIAFHPLPYQLEAERLLEQAERFYALSTPGYRDEVWHHMGTNTGRTPCEGPTLQDLPRTWLDDHRKNVADAFSTLWVSKRINVDEFTKEIARVVAPKNKPWYQKFDKKRRY